ncbi:aminopeptidase Y precursor vacuolar [Fusarium mundagurra]|uniref:Peptide hydrolase n=1 Tax=Fusarium mundagurra TaxID=1567541 RepID=A0A8H5Z2R8_9HYPO|nr:aminopeptidase Y precursor vacuolar [Fusarium mundagurra]
MRLNSSFAALLSLATSHGLAKLHRLDSEKLQADIKASNLIATLDALNDIAFTNGGNRAFGLPGYQASKQTFPALFTFVDSIELNVDNKAIDVYGLTYSPSTTKVGITAEIALGPAAGCDTSSYDDLDVKGKIVLARNFPCRTSEGLAGQVISVAAAGASAVIIYDDPTVNIAAGSLGRPNPGKYVPAGFISHADALKIKDRIEAGETVKAHFQQTQIVEERLTQNIIAETTSGDPHNVIMLGAHLDSVQDGPGINDNGTPLPLAKAHDTNTYRLRFISHSRTLPGTLKLQNQNKIRFAWWGAEENGLLGSKHYTSKLSANDVKNLLVYLNFDMVSKGFFGVADTDGVLMDVKLLKENVNSKTLTINARAAAHILAVLDDRVVCSHMI